MRTNPAQSSTSTTATPVVDVQRVVDIAEGCGADLHHDRLASMRQRPSDRVRRGTRSIALYSQRDVIHNEAAASEAAPSMASTGLQQPAMKERALASTHHALHRP